MRTFLSFKDFRNSLSTLTGWKDGRIALVARRFTITGNSTLNLVEIAGFDCVNSIPIQVITFSYETNEILERLVHGFLVEKTVIMVIIPLTGYHHKVGAHVSPHFRELNKPVIQGTL